MNARQIHTPLTIGSFIVASITGVLLFFEIDPSGVRATHEWMSLLFVLAGSLHIYTNKRPFARYFSDRTLLVILGSIAAGGILYAISFNDIYLAEASYQLLTKTEIAQLSTLLGISHDELLNKLSALNITTVQPGQSLDDIAQRYERDVHDVMELLITP